MTSTAQAICTRALRLINAIGFNDTPGDTQIAIAYQALQTMLDSWKVDRLAVLVVERAVFDLISGTASYTLGPGGTFNRARPVWIPNASYILNSGDEPLEQPIPVYSYDEYQRIGIKTIEALPDSVYYDHAYSAGLGRVYVYPVPNDSTLDLVLYCPTSLTDFSSLTASYDFPPAYLRAVDYNLAVEIAPYFDINPTDRVNFVAAESKGDIRRANIQPYVAMVDSMLRPREGQWNVYTGDYDR